VNLPIANHAKEANRIFYQNGKLISPTVGEQGRNIFGARTPAACWRRTTMVSAERAGKHLILEKRVLSKTLAYPVSAIASPASRACPLPQGPHLPKECAVPVGAGLPANTGAAGASHRVACFAGEPAPTGTPSAERMHRSCGSGRAREHRRSRCQPPRRLPGAALQPIATQGRSYN
jgi:hypothetical protein